MSDTNMFLRDDTFFGVCEALGEDFGIHSNWLRLVFGVSVLLNPVAVISVYFGLGAIVLVSRLVVRNPRAAPVAAAEVAAPREPESREELQLAA